MTSLYSNKASDPKNNAQRNLTGRTYYVDDDTLRWHHSRILSARATAGGWLFAIVESVALDMRNTKRGCRYVIFDVFGDTVGTRVDLEHTWRRSEQAEKAMYKELDTLDAKAITLAAIERAEKYHADEMARMRADLAKDEKQAAA
jgi:hypothetical protein